MPADQWIDVIADALGTLAWPIVVASLGFLFLRTFRAELGRFIEKLDRIKTPLITAESQQDLPSGASPPLDESEERAFEEKLAELEREMARHTEFEKEARDTFSILGSIADTFRDRLNVKEEEAEQWWLRYLSAFLRHDAKRALDLVAEHPAGIDGETLRQLMRLSPLAYKRVVSALLGEKMIGVVPEPSTKSQMRITRAGRRFLEHEHERADADLHALDAPGRQSSSRDSSPSGCSSSSSK